MIHELPPLPYEYNSLEPHIDEETMKIHHDKHHQGYVDKLNKALNGHEELQAKTIHELMKNVESISDEIKQAVINNGGGHINHTFFWEILSKDKPFDENSEIGKEIIKKFENLDNFKTEFSNAAATQFGSGWGWLVLNENNELEILKTKNQDSPISINKTPLIGIDVWEHAYYLKYQNKRPEYIENFFSVINWEKVEEIFVKAKQ